MLVAIMAPGFSEGARRLTADLMVYTIPATALGGVVNVLAAILNVRHRYFLPAIAPALVNATVIPVLFVAGRDGVHVWAVAYLLGDDGEVHWRLGGSGCGGGRARVTGGLLRGCLR